MKKRQILSDGTMVSEIGLGCWSFAGAYGSTTQTESHHTLDTARDLGIDFLDTANVYGMGLSEKIIGAYLKGKPSPFKIATKAGIWRDPATGQRSFNNNSAYLRGELENSLSRLGLDGVDLYYIHRRDQTVTIEDVMDTLLAFKAEGKIRGIGFSEISPATLRRACAVGPVDAVQSEYSLWTRQPELGMIETCKALGVAFVPFSPLGRGMFVDTPPDPTSFGPEHFRTGTPRFSEPNFSNNVAQIDKFRRVAHDLDVTPAALAIAWCLAQGNHLIPIPGTRSAEHLRECAAATEIVMTEEIVQQIDAALPLGWAHGDRYSHAQWVGVEGYC
ncbi:MAG: aldo/keto reductase [Roseobacter sp.]|jgi:aryl-alcohol dehydrogenase-like predicted oxidoreductase|nr:aldo/keto reductase [Roseobacter sp.]